MNLAESILATRSNMAKVFISYSSKDKPFATRLERALNIEGVAVWLDEKRLNVGDSIIQKLGTAINDSDFVVAVLSSASVKSSWVLKELSLAMTREQIEQKACVLPVKIDDCEVPSFLKDKLYADFTDIKNFQASFDRLLKTILNADLDDLCEYCGSLIPLSHTQCLRCKQYVSPYKTREINTRRSRETVISRYRLGGDQSFGKVDFACFCSASNNFEAYVNRRALELIHRAACLAAPKETIGLLLGLTLNDGLGPYTLVLIAEAAQEEETEVIPGQVRITSSGSARMRGRLAGSYPELEVVGWFHSHPAYPPRFSSVDRHEQSTWTSPSHVAIVVTCLPAAERFGLYHGPESNTLDHRSH